ncbi:MAG: 2-oxo acid dehydrogenase subunit E2, partial [Deltaproteobacteria bacterium]|nr:2-oxo acid dehydrogenase subunit E2 [Deltaproteobacteria bacterium]
MPNVDLVRKKDLSSFRRIAIGTWTTAYDPSVYGSMNVRVDRCLAYLEKFRACTGKHVTITHLMAKVAAACLARMPDANAVLR